MENRLPLLLAVEPARLLESHSRCAARGSSGAEGKGKRAATGGGAGKELLNCFMVDVWVRGRNGKVMRRVQADTAISRGLCPPGHARHALGYGPFAPPVQVTRDLAGFWRITYFEVWMALQRLGLPSHSALIAIG